MCVTEGTYSETDHSNTTHKELVLLRESYPTRRSEDTVFNLWLHFLSLEYIQQSYHCHHDMRYVSCWTSKGSLNTFLGAALVLGLKIARGTNDGLRDGRVTGEFPERKRWWTLGWARGFLFLKKWLAQMPEVSSMVWAIFVCCNKLLVASEDERKDQSSVVVWK